MDDPAGTGLDFSVPRQPLAEAIKGIRKSFADTQARGNEAIRQGIPRANLLANRTKSWFI